MSAIVGTKIRSSLNGFNIRIWLSSEKGHLFRTRWDSGYL